ncbi:hypothetical protein GGR53DRAFT_28252 [Hypoxylon sp. FL1150]|nr:hypothetical protein GGR53DRAFT_28252 [Hypoxylon sp. FL1150]
MDAGLSLEDYQALAFMIKEQTKFQRYRLQDLFRAFYKNPIQVVRIPEYTPEVRHILWDNGTAMFEWSWYVRYGVPMEISTGNPNEYIAFKTWMMRTARGWYRTIDMPELPRLVKAEQFGRTVGRRLLVNFFTVVRSRIRKQVKYKWWMDFTCCTFENCLNNNFHDDLLDDEDEDNAWILRQRQINYALFGDLDINDELEYGETIRRFIASEPVRSCFKEYVESYLRPQTEFYGEIEQNSDWSIVQSRLGDMPIGTARQEYGGHIPEEAKGTWSHEDHACRFIWRLYQYMRMYVLESREPLENQGFMSYAFSSTYSLDRLDKHFFGWALLTFLAKCWQHNRQHPKDNYHEVLAPVLYPEWRGGLVVKFPPTKISLLDVNPDTKWEVQEWFSRASLRGGILREAVNSIQQKTFQNPEYESETDIQE